MHKGKIRLHLKKKPKEKGSFRWFMANHLVWIWIVSQWFVFNFSKAPKWPPRHWSMFFFSGSPVRSAVYVSRSWVWSNRSWSSSFVLVKLRRTSQAFLFVSCVYFKPSKNRPELYTHVVTSDRALHFGGILKSRATKGGWLHRQFSTEYKNRHLKNHPRDWTSEVAKLS